MPLKEFRTYIIVSARNPNRHNREILLDLCSLSRLSALSVRSRLIKQRILPGLALQLTLKYIHDEVGISISTTLLITLDLFSCKKQKRLPF